MHSHARRVLKKKAMQMKFCVDMKVQDGQEVSFENSIQEVLCVNHDEI